MQEKKEDGGPAFPVPDPFHMEPKNVAETKRLAAGMSLRDHFAGLAMGGLLVICHGDSHEGVTYPEHVAKNAYEVADAMIAARSA